MTTFNVLDLLQRADRIVIWKNEHDRVVVTNKQFQDLPALDVKAVELSTGRAMLGDRFQIPAQEVEPMDDGIVTFKDVGGRLYLAELTILRPFSAAGALEERIKPWSPDKDRSFFENS